MTSNLKKTQTTSTIRIKEIQLKTDHSINHLFSPKKRYANQLLKKNILNTITSSSKDTKHNDSKNHSIAIKNNDYSNYQTTIGCYNLAKSLPPSNVIKNGNKQIIHYSTNINVHKDKSNPISLFTIQEKMMNMSNGVLTKSLNSNSYYKKPKDQNHVEKLSSSSSKLFQLRKLAYPMNQSNGYNLKATTSVYKSPNKNKGNKCYQNQYNTNPNANTNINIHSNNLRKRNKKCIKPQERITPTRYKSLNKGNNTLHKDIRAVNPTKKPKTCYYNKELSKSKEKSFEKGNKIKKLIKIKNIKDNIFRSNKLSKSLKKEPSYFSNHAKVNITTYNNKREYSRDMQITQTSQNSFLLTSKNNYTSLDSSSDYIRSRIKAEIKVNCKQNSSYYNGRMIIKKYSKYLSQYEIEELSQFAFQIYFILPFEIRIKNNSQLVNNLNSTFSYIHFPNYIKGGISLPRSKSYKYYYDVYSEVDNYNDEEGNYIIIPGEHIFYRYEIIGLLGKGSFGEAIKCLDHKTKEVVCVKIIKANCKFSLQAMIEIKILHHIRKNDYENNSNIVKFYSQFIFRKHICLVFELLDINLYDYLKMNDYVGFEMKKIKVFAIELLFTLLFLKRQKIIHCDLKPENILLLKDKSTHVKVIDFGSSCFENEKLYTYIQSRFYRAPEVILEQGYGILIDMWSLGCILPELFTGIPIFPGENEKDQLIYIIEYLGLPSIEYINKSNKKDIFFDENNQPFTHYNPDGSTRLPKSKTISEFLKGTSEYFQDFVKKCLQWPPKDRMMPETALMHNWIIRDMTSETLFLHKQRIKTIKIGHCQIHKLNSLPASLRPLRAHNKKISSKSNHSQPRSHSKAIYIPKTPNKSPVKRTTSKDIPRNPLTTKFSLTKQKKFHFVYDTNPEIKTTDKLNSQKNNCSYLESSNSKVNSNN